MEYKGKEQYDQECEMAMVNLQLRWCGSYLSNNLKELKLAKGISGESTIQSE